MEGARFQSALFRKCLARSISCNAKISISIPISKTLIPACEISRAYLKMKQCFIFNPSIQNSQEDMEYEKIGREKKAR